MRSTKVFLVYYSSARVFWIHLWLSCSLQWPSIIAYRLHLSISSHINLYRSLNSTNCSFIYAHFALSESPYLWPGNKESNSSTVRVSASILARISLIDSFLYCSTSNSELKSYDWSLSGFCSFLSLKFNFSDLSLRLFSASSNNFYSHGFKWLYFFIDFSSSSFFNFASYLFFTWAFVRESKVSRGGRVFKLSSLQVLPSLIMFDCISQKSQGLNYDVKDYPYFSTVAYLLISYLCFPN